MNFKEAFEAWSALPKNANLSRNNLSGVRRVLLSRYGFTELEEFTESYSRNIFATSMASKCDKVQAASILVYVLQWGAEHGLCPPPSFSYEIESSEQPKDKETPKVTVQPEGERKAEGKPKERRKVVYGGPKNEVCQIDPSTYQVIRTFESCAEACRLAHVSNLPRAIKYLSMAGGYYWQYPADVDTFAQRITAKKMARRGILVPAAAKTPVDKFTDEELIAELRRRGWKGKLTIISEVEL